jgi:LPS sulfotransferase NodH
LTTPMLCKRALFICAVPRSGSTLLCDLLQATGVSGNPMEYAVQENEQIWRHTHGFGDHRSYFIHYAHRLGVTGNGVFSAKLMFRQMAGFVADLKRYKSIDAGGMIETIDLAFGMPRYVQVLRKDKERQAISLVRAEQTGAWASPETTAGRLEYNPAHLDATLALLMRLEDSWNEALTPIDPSRRMTLYYEIIVQDMPGTVSSLLNWLGIAETPRPFRAPSMERQSDAVTEEWLATWRRHRSIAVD